MAVTSDPKDRRGTLITYLALMALILIPFTIMIAPYLMALLMGSILAILGNPFYGWFRKHRLPPYLASGIVTVCFLLLVLTPLTLLTVSGARQANLLITSLTDQGVLTFENILAEVLGSWPFNKLLTDTQEIQEQISSSLSEWAQMLSGWVLKLVTQIPDLLLQLALGIFAAFFLLVDGEALFAWAAGKVPLSRSVRLMFFNSFRDSTVSVIAASAAAAGVQSILFLGAFLVLGIPGAFLASGAIFIFAWVPLIGSLPILVAGSMYLFFKASYIKMAVLISVGLFTGGIDNVVRAMVLRGRTQMHPMVSLVAMFGGITLWGILGVIVGPILAALAIAALETWPSVAQAHGIQMGETGEGSLSPELDQN